MPIDLSPWNQSADLIAAIWAARRDNRRDLSADVLRLLANDDPLVREEVISLIFVAWADRSVRETLKQLLSSDPDYGVRARIAGALGLMSDESSRREDVSILQALVLNQYEHELVRKSAYESLQRIVNAKNQMIGDDVDIDEDLDLDWVRCLLDDG